MRGRPQEFLLAAVQPANLLHRQGAVGPRRAAWGVSALARVGAYHGETVALIPWAAQEHGERLEVLYPASRRLRHSAPNLAADLGVARGSASYLRGG